MKQTIKVDAEKRDELQRLSVEVESRQDLISFMIEKGMDLDSAQFKKYEDEYKNFYLEYQRAKSKFEKETVRPAFEGKTLLNWNLDFNECEVTVEYED